MSPATFRLTSHATALVRGLTTADDIERLADLIHSGTGGTGAHQQAGAVLAALARLVRWAEATAGVDQDGGTIPDWSHDGDGRLLWSPAEWDEGRCRYHTIGDALHDILTAFDEDAP